MTKEIRAAKKIVEYAGFDVKRALNFIEDGTVTFNTGRNKKEYAWLLTENTNVIIDVETFDTVEDEEFIKEQFL